MDFLMELSGYGEAFKNLIATALAEPTSLVEAETEKHVCRHSLHC